MDHRLLLAPLALLLACGTSDEAPKSEPTPVAAGEAKPGETSQPSRTADAANAGMSPAQPGLLTEAQFAALHQLSGEAAPPAKGTSVTIGDTTAYLSLPEGATGPVPAVIVIHEWWGLNGHIKHWTDRLAAAGYAALAVDLYGGTVATTPDDAMMAMKGVDEALAGETLALAHAFLTSDPRVQAPRTGVIGWCFGGGWSLRAALTNAELDAAVLYYGRIPEDLSGLASLQAPVLGVFGERDAGIPISTVRDFETAATEAGKSVTVHIYDADHAFANPSSARYAADAADDAWGKTRDFLAENLKR
ncbi:MAG: dienelactone hydrolase family protein [Deltaproteobacteria bacterium]|nr:dienelactone hydrolase family protein [Deltaproteobacteria bacterium]